MVWISKDRLKELENFEEQCKDNILTKAQEADAVLRALKIEPHTESGKQVRAAIGMEILGQKYDMMDKHSKASYVKDHGIEIMASVRQLLTDEGVLSRKKK